MNTQLLEKAGRFKSPLQTRPVKRIFEITVVPVSKSSEFPIGSVFNKGLTLKSGQANAYKYKQPLMERVERGEIDPSFVITHRLSLDDAPRGYHIFKNKLGGCVKVVMTP